MITLYGKPYDTPEQAYERYKAHMRQIASVPQSEEAKKKQAETYVKRYGKTAHKRNGKLGGRPRGN